MQRLILLFFLCIGTLEAKTILFLGDSLTEGYGIKKNQAYPYVIKQLAKEKLGKNIQVINGGVSGSTTASGLKRLKWYAKKKIDLLVLALGANDGLRGLKLKQSKENLIQIINFAQKRNMQIVLAGLLVPPNYGPKYSQEFKQMFITIKKKKKVTFIPFLLKDVGGKKEFNLSDGIHPNPKGHQVMAKTVFKYLKDKL